MQQISDYELIRRVLDGNESAYANIIKRYQNSVATTAMSMLGDEYESEEVAQETFIRLYNNLKNFRSESQLKTYITRICINLSLNRLKRRKLYMFRNYTLKDTDRHAVLMLPESGFEYREIVTKALMHIDAKSRAIINLRMIQEFSTKETATILGIPEGTVLSRLKRSMDKLKEVLIRDYKYEKH